REALELANKATFTQEELDAYQKVIDEIQQVRELADAKLAEGEAIGLAKGHKTGLAEGLVEGHKAGLAEGHKSGLAEGEPKGHKAGKMAALLAILAARGFSVTEEARARIEACKDEAILDGWIARATTASSIDDVFISADQSV